VPRAQIQQTRRRVERFAREPVVRLAHRPGEQVPERVVMAMFEDAGAVAHHPAHRTQSVGEQPLTFARRVPI